MNLSNPTSVVVPLTAHIAQFYPPNLRTEIEQAAPTLVLQAHRLGTEVLLAEQHGLRFSEAVCHPDFPLMERTYFGAQALLQHRLTPELHDAVKGILQHGLQGGFDPHRKLVFAVASRRGDPDAAMCRFLLWVAIRINLLVATWDAPEVETLGTLADMEEVAEHVLREMLDVPEVIFEPDVRPLAVLVTEMLIHTSASVKERFAVAMREYGGELTEIMTNKDALESVRLLDDRHAVMFNPGPFGGQPGSEQIARRFPQQHPSASALEQTRSRFKKKRRKALAASPKDRLIDVMLGRDGGAK